MKKNQLPNIHGETFIRPPSFEGVQEKVPGPSKVPSIKERNFDNELYDELFELSKKKMKEEEPERLSKMRDQEIENLKRLLQDHEDERSQDKPTFISPPDETGRDTSISPPPSLARDSKLYGYYQKYGSPHTKSPIRPPENDFEVSIPKMRPLPEIKDLTEKEMKDWEEFIAEKKLLKDLDITKEKVDIGKEDKAKEESGTNPAIPKRKRASVLADVLLKKCSKYHDLCRKL